MEFYTQNLHIRPMNQEDREAMLDLLTNDVVKKTYILPDFPNRQAAQPLFERLVDLSGDDCRYVSAICWNEQCIGMINDTEMLEDAVEMGYAILPAYHNRGFATETLRGTIAYLHDHGFSQILTAAFECNPASLRVMVKAGMKKMDRTEDLEYRGVTHTCIYYCAQKGIWK